MQVDIRELEARNAICISHRGPYETIINAFMKLFAWLAESGVKSGPLLALYYDDPETTPADELRSGACSFVPHGFATNDAGVQVVEVAGGTYAVGTHIGPHHQIPNAWQEIITWLRSSGYALREGPMFDVYVDDDSTVPEAQMRTELCIPISVTI